MPEDLGSVMGSNFDTSAQSGKKKLKKVGNHWEDENGVKYADPEGKTALKMDEAGQASAGAPAQSVMQDFGIEKGTGTAGWAIGDPGQETKTSAMDWQATPTDQKKQDQSGGGDDFQEYIGLTYPNGLSESDQKALQDRWNSLTAAEKETWLSNARKRKK